MQCNFSSYAKTFVHQKKPPDPNQIIFFSDEEKF